MKGSAAHLGWPACLGSSSARRPGTAHMPARRRGGDGWGKRVREKTTQTASKALQTDLGASAAPFRCDGGTRELSAARMAAAHRVPELVVSPDARLEVVKAVLLLLKAALVAPAHAIFTAPPDGGLRVHAVVAAHEGEPAWMWWA